MSPLLGGEFLIALLAVRIALWIWRSRVDFRAFFDDGPPGPKGGLPHGRPRLRLVAAPPRQDVPAAPTLQRAA